ncbi:cation diffusion facilitator family transporter [Treponema sp. TIM-1]|uniref:cation diffusion facilitator family transporter n=1 Tax=Treponema sp. TIM-1 TaxID=2898417 RepID=UPI0039812668
MSESTLSAPGPAGRGGIIKTAAISALAGNLFLAILKIGFGISSGSLAVLGDGMDSSVDVLIALMSLLVSVVISRPADAGHPWGHGRAETVATAVLSFILFFAGAQLILNAILSFFSGSIREVPAREALYITVVSIAGKLVLAWSQYLFSKKAASAMLRANAKNMAADVIISLGVLGGLGLSLFFKNGAIDSAAAILVGCWVIKSAVGIFIEANAELMDGGSGTASYRAIFDAVHSVAGAGRPHRARMRRIAGFWDIDMDIEVDPNLTVYEAHRIASQVERAIKERVEGVYDIMIHVEPAGNKENEGFGLCEDTVNGDYEPQNVEK